MRAENKEQGDTKNTPTNKLNDIHSRQEEKVLAALKPIIDERIRYDVPGCMEGTRRSVFEEIDAWSTPRPARMQQPIYLSQG